jgi:hypothetical protein
MSKGPRNGDSVYEVYLVDVDIAGDGAASSPVRTRDIRYYDSGVWVRSDGSRTFYPYAQIRRIEEIDDVEGGGTEEGLGDWRDEADPNLGDDRSDESVPADEL